MLGLSKRESKFFLNSLVLHVVLLSSASILGLMPSCEEKEDVHVFELASTVSEPLFPEESKVAPPSPVKPVEPKPLPQPKPKPPISKPLPKPKVVQRVTPKPKPVPKVAPETISFSQFKKQHKIQAPSPSRPTPPKKVTKVQINPKSFSLPKITISNPSTNTSSVDPTILNRYLGDVKAKLEAVWIRLQSSANLASAGEAYLSFKISSNGTLLSPYISKSSGNSALDKLVLQVGKSVGNVGRPPGGKLSSSLEIPFRIR